ncbi:MAG: hypothetical protein AB4290_29785 [Spirulina sp.]
MRSLLFQSLKKLSSLGENEFFEEHQEEILSIFDVEEVNAILQSRTKKSSSKYVSQPQLNFLFATAREVGLSKAELRQLIRDRFKCDSFKYILREQFDEVVKAVRASIEF